MKVGKKMQNRIEEFCKTSSQLLSSIHSRCGSPDGIPGNGQPKKGRKKRAKRK